MSDEQVEIGTDQNGCAKIFNPCIAIMDGFIMKLSLW